MPLGPLHISKSGQYIRKNDGPNWPAWNVAEMNLNAENHAAYARLFAYAPKCLEMLETLCGGLEWNIDNNILMNESDCEALTAARALIAEIKGGG